MYQINEIPLSGWELLPFNDRIDRHVLTPIPQQVITKLDRFIQRNGITLVINTQKEEYLYPSKTFDLIIAHFTPVKIDSCYRLLKPGGVLLIQSFDLPEDYQIQSEKLIQVGFRILEGYQDFNRVVFYDPGGLIYHLQSPPWDLTNREILKHEQQLNKLYPLIEQQKHIAVETNHLLIVAKR